MKLVKLLEDILDRKTWDRVAQLNKLGFYKDKEKKILYGAPIPSEDKLPLRIMIVLGFMIVILTTVIASSVFSLPINILLGLLIIALILMPIILRTVLKSK